MFIQEKNDNITYIDKLWTKKGIYLYECNAIDGSKDIYIGSEKLKNYDKVCSMPKEIDSACLKSVERFKKLFLVLGVENECEKEISN